MAMLYAVWQCYITYGEVYFFIEIVMNQPGEGGSSPNLHKEGKNTKNEKISTAIPLENFQIFNKKL